MSVSFCAVDADGRRALFLAAEPIQEHHKVVIVGCIHRGKTLPLDQAIALWRARDWQRIEHTKPNTNKDR